MKLVFVRHGPAQHNLPGWSGNMAMAELTPAGRRAVVASGQQLSQFKFAAIYASPLVRARQTAEIIAQSQTKPAVVQIDARLADVAPARPNPSRWDLGLLRSKLRRRRQNAAPGALRDEQLEQAGGPIVSFVRDLRQHHRRGPILIVGHLVTFWALVQYLGEPVGPEGRSNEFIELAAWVEFEVKRRPITDSRL